MGSLSKAWNEGRAWSPRTKARERTVSSAWGPRRALGSPSEAPPSQPVFPKGSVPRGSEGDCLGILGVVYGLLLKAPLFLAGGCSPGDREGGLVNSDGWG